MGQIIIDKSACVRCGYCITDCPRDIYVKDVDGYPATPDLTACHQCGHCVAVCPVNAIRYEDFQNGTFKDKTTVKVDNISELLASIRSARHYKQRSLSKKILEDIMSAAGCGATAKNTRNVHAFLVSGKDNIRLMEESVVKHYGHILKWLSPLVIKLIRLFSKKFYEYVISVKPSLVKMQEDFQNNKAPVFHHAPHVIVFYAPSSDGLSRDNCIIAQQYAVIKANAEGLGTCVIGYAVVAKKALEKILNIPDEYSIYAVMTLGESLFPYKKAIYREMACHYEHL